MAMWSSTPRPTSYHLSPPLPKYPTGLGHQVFRIQYPDPEPGSGWYHILKPGVAGQVGLWARHGRGSRPWPIMDTLPDEVLLEVFEYCLCSQTIRDNAWWKLLHVCRRWRHVIIESSRRLGLTLQCAPGTPVRNMITHSPPFPIVALYGHCYVPCNAAHVPHICQDWSASDEDELQFAFSQHFPRMQAVALRAPASVISSLAGSMDRPAPMLKYFRLESSTRTHAPVALSERFLNGKAPHLRSLQLVGVTLPPSQPLLLSATSLVTLTLERIPGSACTPPEVLAAHMQGLSLLEELSIQFTSSPPRRIGLPQLSAPNQRVKLPRLKRISYRGTYAYLETIIASIHAPHLNTFHAQLFNQLTLRTPYITDLLFQPLIPRATPTHSFLRLDFGQGKVLITLENEETIRRITVTCDRFDFQLAALGQIIGSHRTDSDLHTVTSLIVQLCPQCQWSPSDWKGTADPSLWHALLAPFRGVSELEVSPELVEELGNALGSAPSAAEMLPQLRMVTFKVVDGLRDTTSGTFCAARTVGFQEFADARARAGCPVRFQVSDSTKDPGAFYHCSEKHDPTNSSVAQIQAAPTEAAPPPSVRTRNFRKRR